MLKNLSLGKAGELRIASELLLRGHEVFLTIVDSGSDLVLGNGKRLQVKVAQRRHDKAANRTAYMFSFKSWRKRENKYIAHPLADVDYIILWGLDDDLFLIIPSSEVRGRHSIRCNPTSKSTNNVVSHYLQFRNRWDLLQ